jgi:citrate lyase subunit beta/citryl-CoA lyase
MTGKLCLSTDQVGVVNEAFSPTANDVAWAAEFLDEFVSRGNTVSDGSDLPRLGRAQKIRAAAVAFGIAG